MTEYLLVSFLPNPILSRLYLLFITITSVLSHGQVYFSNSLVAEGTIFPIHLCVRSWRMAADFLLNFPVLLSILLNHIIREQQTRLRLHWGGKSLTEILSCTTSLQQHYKKIVICLSYWVVYGSPFLSCDYIGKHKFWKNFLVSN